MSIENYNSHLLTKPCAKNGDQFVRSYPFPIVTQECESNQSDPNWNIVDGELQEDCVLVKDEKSIVRLYTMGFYGKGTLSKNAPALLLKKKRKRTKRQKTSHPGSSKETSTEKVVIRIDSDDNSQSTSPKVSTDVHEDLIHSSESDSSSEDEGREKEYLQLTFEEAYFLSYGLGCLIVLEDKTRAPMNLARLWTKFCELSPSVDFPIMYTAYHHFRSKGWIVKCGVKYGVDYILYKDGPPFYHATYAVLVKPVKEKQLRDVRDSKQLTWSFLAGLNRINNTAGKALMILYVIKPEIASESKIATPYCLSQYKLEEVIVKRWVPAGSREDNEEEET